MYMKYNYIGTEYHGFLERTAKYKVWQNFFHRPRGNGIGRYFVFGRSIISCFFHAQCCLDSRPAGNTNYIGSISVKYHIKVQPLSN